MTPHLIFNAILKLVSTTPPPPHVHASGAKVHLSQLSLSWFSPYFSNPQLSFSKPPTFTFTTLNFHFHNSQLPLSQLSTFTSFNFHFHNSHFHNSTLPTRVQFQISLTSFNFSDNSPRIASSSKNLPWRMMIVNDDNLEDQGSANTGIYFS